MLASQFVVIPSVQANTFIFSDGFESGNLLSWTGSTQIALTQQLVNEGAWAARATSTGRPTYAYYNMPAPNPPELYYRIFFNLLSNPTAVTLLRLRTASGGVIFAVGVNATSKLFTNIPAIPKSRTGSSVARGVWHELQVHILVNGSSSREDVWLDGIAAPGLSAVDPIGTASIGRIDLGDSTSKRTFDVAFDDVVAGPSFIDTRAPNVPTGLAVSSFSEQDVALAWNAPLDNVGVTGYTVYRSDDEGATYNPLGTSATTDYQDTPLPASMTYSYIVDAYDAAGNHSALSTSVTATTLAGPDTEKPDQPIGLSLIVVNAYSLDLTWSASSDNVGVTGYTIYRSADEGATYDPVGTSVTTSYADHGVTASTTYSYVVDAFDAAGNHSDQSTSVAATTPAGFTTPIRHIVIIYQENHSFDNVLGKLCEEIGAGVITGHAPCDGATSGTSSTGAILPLAPASDLIPNPDHTIKGQGIAINSGGMNGFDRIAGCGASTGYACYSQYDPLSGPCGTGTESCIPNLSALAESFTISDRTFEFATSPSFGGHMVLGSATLDGFEGNNPRLSTFTTQTGPGWGCNSYKDENWWNGAEYVLVPSCVPDQAGSGPYRASPVPYVPTIFDRLDAGGLSWRLYTSSTTGWAICPFFYECLGSGQANNMVGPNQVLSDAQVGVLPNFSIVIPAGSNSQHGGNSMVVGDNWIGQVVSAIENGPDWSSTAIFITYDDCGCFYDHVPPPNAATGIRVPMVIVSPYAKAGFTDSTSATYLSMLAYAEHAYSLPPLNANDANAYDYANTFDYAQPPLTPVSLGHTQIPSVERAYLAAHPPQHDVT